MAATVFALLKNTHGFNVKDKKSVSYRMPYGQKVEVLEKLGSDVVDEEVGAMYHVVGADGQTWQVFAEELEFEEV